MTNQNIFYFSLYKQKLLCDNNIVKPLESILLNQLIMVGKCLSVRTTALLMGVTTSRPLLFDEVTL